MPLEIAIVGFGRMAQNYYAPALKRLLPDARYAIVDPAEEAREKAQRIFRKSRCLDAVEDLAGSALDAALIASPPASHFHAWRSLASRNVPIFMEKPFPLPDEIALVAELDDVAAGRERGVDAPDELVGVQAVVGDEVEAGAGHAPQELGAPGGSLCSSGIRGRIGGVGHAPLQANHARTAGPAARGGRSVPCH